MRATGRLILLAACALPLLLALVPAPVDSVPVFITGGERGALEPCGCASGQLGGLARRATVLALERPTTANALTLSCGGILRDNTALDALTLQTMMTALGTMQYDAHVPSARELRLGRAAIESAMPVGPPWLAANVTAAAEPPAGFLPSFQRTVRGRPVTVVGLTLPDGEPPADYVIADPAAALAALDTALAAAEDGLLVIVLAGPWEQARALAAAAGPRFHDALMLVGDPDSSFTTQPRDGHLLSPGQRGQYMLKADAAHAGGEPQLIPLGENWPKDPGVEALVHTHRQRIVNEGLLDSMYERTDPPDGLSYAGPSSCFDCHEAAHATWSASKHAHAIEALLPEERQLDPDCLQCHSTGFGSRSGFAGLERTRSLAGVTCESCHGPASAHVARPYQAPLRKDFRCGECHDPENSPHFDREVYWPRIVHGR